MGKGLPTRAGCSTTGNVRLNVIRTKRENSGQTKLPQAFLSTFFRSILKEPLPGPRFQGKSFLRKEQVFQTWVSGASRRDLGSSPSSAPDFLCDLQVLPGPQPPASVLASAERTYTLLYDAQGSLLVPTHRPSWASTICLLHQRWLRGRSFAQKSPPPAGWMPSTWGLTSGVARALLSWNTIQ